MFILYTIVRKKPSKANEHITSVTARRHSVHHVMSRDRPRGNIGTSSEQSRKDAPLLRTTTPLFYSYSAAHVLIFESGIYSSF